MMRRGSGSSCRTTEARTSSAITPPSRRTASAPWPRGRRSSSRCRRDRRGFRPRTFVPSRKRGGDGVTSPVPRGSGSFCIWRTRAAQIEQETERAGAPRAAQGKGRAPRAAQKGARGTRGSRRRGSRHCRDHSRAAAKERRRGNRSLRNCFAGGRGRRIREKLFQLVLARRGVLFAEADQLARILDVEDEEAEHVGGVA